MEVPKIVYMLADDSPNLSIYLNLYALGQVEYN